MGGLLIIMTLNVTTLLWAQWNTLVQLTLLSVVVLAGLGFFTMITPKSSRPAAGGRENHVLKLWVQNRARGLYRDLLVAIARHEPSDYRHHGFPFTNIPSPSAREAVGSGADHPDHCGQLERGSNLTDGFGWLGHRLHADRLVCFL